MSNVLSKEDEVIEELNTPPDVSELYFSESQVEPVVADEEVPDIDSSKQDLAEVTTSECSDERPTSTRKMELLLERAGDVASPSAKKRRAGVKCYCEAFEQEAEMNARGPVIAVEAAVEKLRIPHLTPLDTYLMSEFTIGKEMFVKVCLLRNEMLDVDERLVLIIKQGRYEIRLPALVFLEKSVRCVDAAFLQCYDEYQCFNVLNFCGNRAQAEFQNHSDMTWMVLRQFVNDYTSEKIHMSASTWVEFKALLPILKLSTEYYLGLVMSRRCLKQFPFEHQMV